MALPQSLLAATGKHGECHNLCDEAATLFLVGFVPYLNSALQIRKSVKEVKAAEEAPEIQSECVGEVCLSLQPSWQLWKVLLQHHQINSGT